MLQDFYNLVDVYLDAVLHPKCIEDERTFAQEGWHYELEDPKVSPDPDLDYGSSVKVISRQMLGVHTKLPASQ